MPTSQPLSRSAPTRRGLLLGAMAGLGAAAAGCSTGDTPPGTAQTFDPAPSMTPTPGQRVSSHSLVAKTTTVDLGGITVDTWAYGDTVPGPLLRARAGDLLRITLDNQLPDETTIHWHGIRLRAAADGVPGLTQDPIRSDTTYVYEFTAPDPGTYFFHPHVGVQLDRALYAPLIIDDPDEPGDYDHEWVVVLDDWIDGTGTTPEEVLANLVSGTNPDTRLAPTPSPTNGLDGGGSPFGGAGDVQYPHYLINGRLPTAPDVLRAKPGQRVRIRLINAASDTIFSVALSDHRMNVTHSDGWPVQPRETEALYIGMGERYDVEVTLADGVFPLVAAPLGKHGQARALIRTGTGRTPGAQTTPTELQGPVLMGTDLLPAEAATLSSKDPDDQQMLHLTGQNEPYAWAINGKPFGENEALRVTEDARTRMHMMNMTMMTHPMHMHGHTFALPNGLRKGTVLIPPMGSIYVDFDTDNPGSWMVHCHNIYHAEAGMMIAMNYES